MSLTMTRAEREAFLAAVRVAIISVDDPGRGPLTVPVWYRFEPGGDLVFLTGGKSKKARLIRGAGRISLCVQTETPPYQYVSVEGPVRFETPDFEQDVRGIAHRYLGEQMGEMYLQMTAADRTADPNVRIRLIPEHWSTVDYGKMGR